MQVYIHYNLHGGHPEAHSEVKSQMLALGYFDHYVVGTTTYNLPNTSLWHKNKLNPDAAKADLNNIVNAINRTRIPSNYARIKRCVAMPFANVSAIEGDPHTA